MEYNGISLTEEQMDAVDFMAGGEDLKIQSPAGSGKTFVLLVGANHMDGRGLNLTFNRAIAMEAASKFPKHVLCKTGHALAFGNVGYKYKDRLKKYTGTQLFHDHGVGDASLFGTPASKAYLMLDTIRRFCYSDSREITRFHVPLLKSNVSAEIKLEMEEDLVKQSTRIWERMSDPNDATPITHDVYLKVWALSEPDLKKDFLLFDEAQDANAVILDVVRKQKDMQVIYVGDKFQQIYGWRGATNAMQTIETANTAYITQSFRFGQGVADIANEIIHSYTKPEDRPPLIRGFDEKDSIVVNDPVANPDCIIYRTNSGVMSEVFHQLVMYPDKRVYIMGGPDALINLLKGVQNLKEGKRSWHPDLFLFNDFQELVDYSGTEIGGEMKFLVNLVNDHGIDATIQALRQTVSYPQEADVTITTAHKSKGLEWEVVRLGNDFFTVNEGQVMPQEEVNLLYVAATRALGVLDISQCDAVQPESFYQARVTWGGINA